jgi:hypothetical protein
VKENGSYFACRCALVARAQGSSPKVLDRTAVSRRRAPSTSALRCVGQVTVLMVALQIDRKSASLSSSKCATGDDGERRGLCGRAPRRTMRGVSDCAAAVLSTSSNSSSN